MFRSLVFLLAIVSTSAFTVVPANTRSSHSSSRLYLDLPGDVDPLVLVAGGVAAIGAVGAAVISSKLEGIDEGGSPTPSPAASADTTSEEVDLSIPYDAAAMLAYKAAGSPGDYAAFKEKYEEDAVSDVTAKNMDISIPYDAAARMAYEAAGRPGDYAAFKDKYEADAVADVIGKK
ncbi:expressed unknown protein [Seminavis robusta]|uniref:Uncharacterized protein n=1 Tax=Seminavis robusta TaxID=568900 RepID=A0A9N8DVD3_9STRA|nr:expressed unknown protein [Seminavis robusta]|eukprot:Sro372_g128700.1 n/a (176) ;mRNA; f:12797-13324